MSKLKKIIKKAILNVKIINTNSIPGIFATYYYGDYKVDAGLLVIVYIFKTDFNLNLAVNNGLTKKIEKETKENLINNGYPMNAFAQDSSVSSEQTFFERLNNHKVSTIFISNQRVKEEANGILYEYLK